MFEMAVDMYENEVLVKIFFRMMDLVFGMMDAEIGWTLTRVN